MPNKWFEEKIGRKEQKHILFPAQWRQPQFETDPFELGKAFLVHHFISNRGVRSKAQLQRETTKKHLSVVPQQSVGLSSQKLLPICGYNWKSQFTSCLSACLASKNSFLFPNPTITIIGKIFFCLFQEFEIIFADFSHCRLKLKVTECTKCPWLEIEKRWFTSHSLWSTSILCRISLYLL